MLRSVNKRNARCVICGNSVALEASNTDEQGNAVHEECYVARIVMLAAAQREATQLSAMRLLSLEQISPAAFATK